MYRLLLSLAIFFTFTHTIFAAGVGSSLEVILQSGFANFFNIEAQKTEKLELGLREIHYKTGGFKEHIDLVLTVDNKDIVTNAQLSVALPFIAEQNRMAIDVIKSFIGGFCPEQDAAVCKTLSSRLWLGKGEVAPELSGIMSLLNGKKKWDCAPLQASVLNTELQEKVLVFEYHFINWERQAIPEQLFITADDLAKYQLELQEEKKNAKIWTGTNNSCSRVVDGRWHFKTAVGAKCYYQAYQNKLSEGMALINDFNEKLGSESHAYETGPAQQEMLAALGAEIKEEFYCFVIRKNKTIAKVFLVVSPEASLKTATQIAKKAFN